MKKDWAKVYTTLYNDPYAVIKCKSEESPTLMLLLSVSLTLVGKGESDPYAVINRKYEVSRERKV